MGIKKFNYQEFPIRVWEFFTGKLLRTLGGHAERISSIADSVNNQTIVSGNTHTSTKQYTEISKDPLKIQSSISNKKLIFETLKIIDSSVDGIGRVSVRTLSRRLGISTPEAVGRICDLLLDNNDLD